MKLESIILFLFGLVLGSFLNVLASRYEPERRIFNSRSLGGRSHCLSCGKKLRWFELVPIISFIIQRGRCSFCDRRLSFQYPFVELASGIALAVIPYAVFEAFQVNFHRTALGLPIWYYILSIVFIVAALTLILLSAIDFRLRIIPDQTNVLIAVLGLAVAFIKSRYGIFGDFEGSFTEYYAAIFGLRNNVWLNHFSAAFLGLAFFGLIVVLTRGRGMGMGDVKLAGASGLLLGWPDAGLAFLLAFIAGAIWSIILMALGQKKMKSTVPFGPFIALGIGLVIFFGKAILDYYFFLFS
ncbi:MAG TPA: prepilin peptidase [Candidatus Paceibacterota bacterium]